MATFIADTVDDSQLDYGNTSITKVRGGIVTGLAGDPSTALEQCIDAATDAGISLGSTATIAGRTLILSRLIAKPFSADSARCQLVYNNDWGAAATAYVITVDNYEQSYQTDLIPGTRVPMYIDPWQDVGDPAGVVAGDNFTAVFTRTITDVTISGIKAGSETPEYKQSVNKVNAADWYDYPRAWWKVTRGQTSISKYSGYFSFLLGASAKGDEDWSEIGTLVNRATGRKVLVTPSDLAAMLAENYVHGIIKKVNGAIRVGPYHPLEFTTIFPAL